MSMTLINTLPEWCLSETPFSPSTRILLFFFLYSVNLQMRVSAGQLVARGNFPRQTFSRAVQQLVESGLVTRHARESKSNGHIYELRVDKLVELGAPYVGEFFKGYKHGLETKN